MLKASTIQRRQQLLRRDDYWRDGVVNTVYIGTSLHHRRLQIGCRVSDVTSVKGGDIKVGRRQSH